MGKNLKKFKCMNCGKTFEMPIAAEDPMRCPYCGVGPGALVRVSDDYKDTSAPAPQIPNQQQTILPPTSPAPMGMKRFLCYNCNKIIEVPYGVPKPLQCPYCGAPHYMIHRIGPRGGGWGGRRGFGRGRWRYVW